MCARAGEHFSHALSAAWNLIDMQGPFLHRRRERLPAILMSSDTLKCKIDFDSEPEVVALRSQSTPIRFDVTQARHLTQTRVD